VSAKGAWWLAFAAPLTIIELVVPLWAERNEPITWHPAHIGERYGLFTIIVLGESVLAATVAMQTAVDEGTAFGDLLTVAAGSFLIVASMWWMYFEMPVDQLLSRARQAFTDRRKSQSFR